MGKSSKNTSTTNTVAEPWSAAQPFLSELLGHAQGTFGAGGFDVQPWPGIRVAPQSTMTQNAMHSFYNTGSAGNPITPVATDAFRDLTSSDHINPALAQLKQNTLADVIPAVSSRFANSGMLDSTLAGDTIARSAAEAVAPIEYGAWDSAQNRRLGALGMAPGLAANQYLDASMMQQAGSQMDAYNQSVLDSARQAYGEAANRPYDELQRAASLALGFGGLGGTQTGSETRPGGNTALQTAGGVVSLASSILPFLAMFGSDRRLKRDIRPIGRKSLEGYPLYAFRYYGENATHIGVMADEVPPEITMDVGGYKFVDYSKVTI